MADGSFRIPAIWSSAHLLILRMGVNGGNGCHVSACTSCLFNKNMERKIWFIQFVVTAIGIASFAGMLYWSPQNAILPGILTFLGILMFIFQMVMTLKKQSKPTILTAFVGTSLVCLFITIAMGIALVYCLKTGFRCNTYQALFKTHLLMGVTGWFTCLIFGFSYKMVPMFSLSHGFPMVQARYVLWVLSIGTCYNWLFFLYW